MGQVLGLSGSVFRMYCRFQGLVYGESGEWRGGGGLIRILGRCKSDYKGCFKAFQSSRVWGLQGLNPKP